MKIKEFFCQKCENSFFIPNFSLEDKNFLIQNFESPMKNILFIKEKHNLDLENSKLIVLHFNKSNGICHNCMKENSSEYIATCQFCKSLNINL